MLQWDYAADAYIKVAGAHNLSWDLWLYIMQVSVWKIQEVKEAAAAF